MDALNDSLGEKTESGRKAGPADQVRAHRVEATACNAAPVVRKLMAEVGVILLKSPRLSPFRENFRIIEPRLQLADCANGTATWTCESTRDQDSGVTAFEVTLVDEDIQGSTPHFRVTGRGQDIRTDGIGKEDLLTALLSFLQNNDVP